MSVLDDRLIDSVLDALQHVIDTHNPDEAGINVGESFRRADVYSIASYIHSGIRFGRIKIEALDDLLCTTLGLALGTDSVRSTLIENPLESLRARYDGAGSKIVAKTLIDCYIEAERSIPARALLKLLESEEHMRKAIEARAQTESA